MDLQHEYSVLGGYNRAKIGHTIGGISAAISTAIFSLVTAVIALLESYGFSESIPKVIAWPISAGAIYIVLYYIFSRYAWKIWPLKKLLKVPDLSGQWHCDGQKLNPDKTLSKAWHGTVTITQDWDKLRIRLKTSQSGSVSIAAALFYDDIDGFRLLYNYKNDPKPDQAELQAHRGFADLTFDANLKLAEGDYFNGQGRFSFGTMKLTRL